MGVSQSSPSRCTLALQRELFIDNLLVRIHVIIEMIRWTGLAPWEFEFPFPGSLISTFITQVPRREVMAMKQEASAFGAQCDDALTLTP